MLHERTQSQGPIDITQHLEDKEQWQPVALCLTADNLRLEGTAQDGLEEKAGAGYMSLYLCHHSWRWTSQKKVSRLLYTDFKREEKCEETKSPRVQWKQNRKCLLCGNPRKLFLGMDCPSKGCIILHLKF